MQKLKSYLPLIIILFLSFFFRFYNFQNLQYWSADEEIAGATVFRMIFGKTISLVSFNTNLASSLGSFFHILSVPAFLISSLNPIDVLLLSGSLGILTTIFIYWAGKLIGGNRLGLISAFLYSSSFLIGIFDRRWWPITPNPFLASLAIISLIKIIQHKSSVFWIFLTITIGFSFHSDPSLAVIAVCSIFSFIILKPKISVKGLILGLITLSVFIAPLAFFEFRHPGTIIKPLLISMSKNSHSGKLISFNVAPLSLAAETVGRILSPNPSKAIENQFSWTEEPQKPLLSPIPEILGIILVFYPLVLIIRNKIKQKEERKALIIVNIFLVSFFLGTTIYGSLYGKGIHQHYFTVIFPVFIMLIAYSLSKITIDKKIALIATLSLFLFLNLNALMNSSLMYPLSMKEKLVKDLSTEIGKSDFSLYVVGGEYLGSGGYTELFILNGKNPKKSYMYPFYDWMYKAHSLYTITPTSVDQEKIVVIGSSIDLIYDKTKEILKTREGNIEGVVLDNSTNWFEEKMIQN